MFGENLERDENDNNLQSKSSEESTEYNNEDSGFDSADSSIDQVYEDSGLTPYELGDAKPINQLQLLLFLTNFKYQISHKKEGRQILDGVELSRIIGAYIKTDPSYLFSKTVADNNQILILRNAIASNVNPELAQEYFSKRFLNLLNNPQLPIGLLHAFITSDFELTQKSLSLQDIEIVLINLVDSYGQNLLHIAAYLGDSVMMENLLSKNCWSSEAVNKLAGCWKGTKLWAYTPLHVVLGLPQIIQDKELSKNIKPTFTPVDSGSQYKLVKLLLDAGADPNLPETYRERFPIHLAPSLGDIRSIYCLFRYGSKMKPFDAVKDFYSETPRNKVREGQKVGIDKEARRFVTYAFLEFLEEIDDENKDEETNKIARRAPLTSLKNIEGKTFIGFVCGKYPHRLIEVINVMYWDGMLGKLPANDNNNNNNSGQDSSHVIDINIVISFAIETNNYLIIPALILLGADLTHVKSTDEKMSFLLRFASIPMPTQQENQKSSDVLRELRSADVSKPSEGVVNALRLCQSRNIFLHEENDNTGKNLLHLAVQNQDGKKENFVMMCLLIASGLIPINTTYSYVNNKYTALDIAKNKGDQELIRLLESAGAQGFSIAREQQVQQQVLDQLNKLKAPIEERIAEIRAISPKSTSEGKVTVTENPIFTIKKLKPELEKLKEELKQIKNIIKKVGEGTRLFQMKPPSDFKFKKEILKELDRIACEEESAHTGRKVEKSSFGIDLEGSASPQSSPPSVKSSASGPIKTPFFAGSPRDRQRQPSLPTKSSAAVPAPNSGATQIAGNNTNNNNNNNNNNNPQGTQTTSPSRTPSPRIS